MKKPIVLDCSVTLSWCFEDEFSAVSNSALEYTRKHEAVVPSLWGLEVTNGLIQANKRKRISLEGVLEFLELFARLPIRSVSLPVTDCFTTVFALAHEHGLSSYDASYLHLAIRERLLLATLDISLQRVARHFDVLWAPK